MVLFGQRLPEDAYEEASREAETCRVVLAIGTSVLVRPASDIPYIALQAGAKLVEVNTEATDLTQVAHLRYDGDADQFARLLLEKLQTAGA